MNSTEVGRLVPLAMVALGNAAVDLDNGTLPEWQCHELARALDNLSAALPGAGDGSEHRRRLFGPLRAVDESTSPRESRGG